MSEKANTFGVLNLGNQVLLGEGGNCLVDAGGELSNVGNQGGRNNLMVPGSHFSL